MLVSPVWSQNYSTMSSENINLISLKCLLFLFFGGLGCLLPGLAHAGLQLGLHLDELRIVSVVAPCVALFGPLIAGPVADRLGVPAQGSAARYGRYMRSMLVISTLLGGVFYTALLYIPQVSRLHERNPPVSFVCSSEGAVVMQDQCQEIPCYEWPTDNRGTLFLSACRHVCGEGLVPGAFFNTELPPTTDDEEVDSGMKDLQKRDLSRDMPKLCFDQNGQLVCHVYTEYSKQLPINVTLAPSPMPQHPSEWCSYKILDKITCKLPPFSISEEAEKENCTVVCDLDDAYNHSDSLLIQSECRHTFGDPQLTFWTFLVLRSVADIFPTTVLALLASCLIVAARDKPALLCHQFIYAVLGFALIPFLVDFIDDVLPSDPLPNKHMHSYGYNIITFAFLSVVSALILLFDRSLPLSPVDYHLHTGPGYLSLRGAGGEIGALSLVLILLGLLSSATDSYLPWESVVLAVLPCVLVLWQSEKVVDYCGHSNILILAFTFYIVRYTGLLMCEEIWALFIFGALEVFTLVLSWSTAILYLRHLVPHNFLVTGQVLAVIAFLCIGRCLGSLLSGLLMEHNKTSQTTAPKWSDYYSETLYETNAVLAAAVASVYFLLYHCCLKHKWRKQSSKLTPPVLHDANANGTYTPLKIYNQPVKDQRIRY